MSNPIRFYPEEPLHPDILRGLPVTFNMAVMPLHYRACLVRLLTGTVNIRCNLSGEVIEQRNNYSQLIYSLNKKITKTTLRKAVAPYTLLQLDKYFRKNLNSNYRFYKELFIEFSNYFLCIHQSNQLAAFLHLYRILESSAYCFPLIWAARAKDYEGTFNELRIYFNGDKTGELGVFNRFVEEKIDPAILNTQIKFTITSTHPDWQKRYFNTLLKNTFTDDIVSSTPDSEIIVNCHGLISLLINIRNKYFHFLTGRGHNLNSDDIVDPNEFFTIVNESLANWLSVIFFEILDHEMSNS